MISLRYSKLWLALTLVAAMVLTIGAPPAVAAACGAQGAPEAVQGQSTGPGAAGCGMSGEPRACCCGRGAGTAHASAGPDLATRHALGQPGCGCSLDAPTVPAAAGVKAAGLVFSPGLAVLPDAPVVLPLPTGRSWALPADGGPPRSPCTSSGPSRAPPAC